jgi:hypothetical protein
MGPADVGAGRRGVTAMTTLLVTLRPSLRLRTVALAAVFGFTTFFVQMAPTDVPLPRPEALTPQPAAALGCADEPAFTGHVTNTAQTTTAATISRTGGVYGYISDVLDDWSCTAYYRYDGLAWMRDDGEGDANYQWGTLINSTSVPCNWVVGETSYLKANGDAHCHTSDADHAMQLQLDNFTGDLQEGAWHADNSPDAPGDFMFVHSDCTSYYAGSGTPGQRMRWNVTFASTDVVNRPGDNCDPSVIDGTGTSQTIVVDGTNPTSAVSATSPVGTRTVPVGWTANDDGPAGIAEVRIYRATAAGGPYTLCKTITTTAASGSSTCVVPADGTFHLASSASDQNGNDEPTPTASEDSVLVDTVDPTNGTISINAGAAWSNDPEGDVTLSLGVVDANPATVRFSNDGTNWSGWQTYGPSKAWVLSAGDGTKTVRVQYRDVALNSSPTYSDTIGYDETLPSATIAINGGAGTTYATAVTLNVTNSDASSGVASTAASNDGSTFTAVTGTAPSWTLTAGAGTKTVWYRVIDTAGNPRTISDTISYVPDATPPTKPAVADLVATSDSGSSATDNVTNDATPTFSGAASSVEANATVKLFVDGVLKGQAVADASGTWAITATSVSDGVHAVTVTATDAANNTSLASDPLSVTIDTSVPAAPTALDLQTDSDSGASDIDDLTNDTTPTVTGSALTGTTVTLRSGATPIGTGSVPATTWTITASSLSDGVKSITAIATDVAGNLSEPSVALSLTIDAASPAAPSIPDLSAGSDTGISDSDDITTDTTLTFSGTAEDGETVTINAGGNALGSATVAAEGWTITTTGVGDGVHSITAQAVDSAGNGSAPTSAIDITIDTVAPSGDFTFPDEGQTASATAASVEIAWDEIDGTSGVTTRSLQRQSAQAGNDGCPEAGWSDQGAPTTGSSPAEELGLDPVSCHRWELTLTDIAGNESQTTSGSIFIDAVTVTAPASGQVLFGLEAIEAVIQGFSTVVQVDFFVDGQPVGSDSAAPFALSWDTTSLPNGEHAINAVALMAGGASVDSPEMAVSVDNDLDALSRLRIDLDTGRMTRDDGAIQAIYVTGAPNAADARYQSGLPDGSADVSEFLEPFATLSVQTQDQINAFMSQPFRGTLYAPPPGVTVVGDDDPAFVECGYTRESDFELPDSGPILEYYCIHETEHFKFDYFLESSSISYGTKKDDNVDADLVCSPQEQTPCSDGIPDMVNRLSVGLEESWDAYEGLSYKAPVAVGEKVPIHLDIPISEGDGLTSKILPFDSTSVTILPQNGRAFYLSRHELFHVFQFGYASPGLEPLTDNSWWFEATAEWAAHKASVGNVHQDRDANGQIFISYDNAIGGYLDSPTMPLDHPEQEGMQREYGLFVLAEYLEDRYTDPDIIRRTWAGMESGLHADEAIRNEIQVLGESFGDVFEEFAQRVYAMDWPNEPDLPLWLAQLQLDGSAATSGDGTDPRPRPARTNVPLALNTPQSGQVTIQPGGFAVLELVPTVLGLGRITVEVAQDPDRDLRALLLPISTLPNVCPGFSPIPIAFDPDGVAYGEGPGTAPCEYLAVIITHGDPFGGGDETVQYTVEYSDRTTFDDFDRPAVVGEGFGVSTIGTTWFAGPSGTVSPDAFEIDGELGIIWAHPYTPSGAYADPWTALQINQQLPLELELRFKVDPYSWSDADGSFNVVFEVRDAASDIDATDSAGVYLSASTAQPETMRAGVMGGWNYPEPQLPFQDGAWYRLKLQIEPTRISHKVWLDTDNEPASWTAVDEAPAGQALGFTPAYFSIMSGNASGVRLYIDWIVGSAP